MSQRAGRTAFKPGGQRSDANLSRNKGMVLAALSNKVTNKFKSFCKTELMDRFLHACIEYFVAFFELQQHLSEAAEEASKTESKNSSRDRDGGADRPQASTVASAHTGTSIELEGAARARLREVATLYAAILVQHSNYANTQQARVVALFLVSVGFVCGSLCLLLRLREEGWGSLGIEQDRQFFETLYDFSARVLFTINDRKRWHAIENELGRVFRSEHFNLSLRKNEQTSTKPLKYKELYALKQELDPLQRTGHADAMRHSSIHTAMHMRSPIIATIFPTPKERMQRAAELQHSIGFDNTANSTDLPPTQQRGRFGNSVHTDATQHLPARDEEQRVRNIQQPNRNLTSEELMDKKIDQVGEEIEVL